MEDNSLIGVAPHNAILHCKVIKWTTKQIILFHGTPITIYKVKVLYLIFILIL